MKIAKREKKLIDFATDFCADTGVALEDMRKTVVTGRERFVACLIRATIIFLCTFGATGLFISSFDLPCYTWFLCVACLVLSFVVSLLYYNKIIFNVGYIAFFFLFCIMSFFLIIWANSGINAILNILMEAVDEKLNLDGIRQYNEEIENRYLSITSCLFLINGLSVCFLNSLISGYRSAGLVFLQMLPVVQICMYFDDSLNYFYLGMIVVGCLVLLSLQRSKRFTISFDKNVVNVTVKKNVVSYGTVGGLRGIFEIIKGTIPMAVVLYAICGLMVFFTPLSLKSNYSSWKDVTDPYIEEFAINGIFSYFNQYSSTGGMSNGRLGGVRQITMDFETDLIVSFVPYSYDTLYLRGYIGETYVKNQWNQYGAAHRVLMGEPYNLGDFESLVNKEALLLERIYEEGEYYAAKATFQIRNIAANTNYCYFPYNSMVSASTFGSNMNYEYYGDVIKGGIQPGRIYTVDYYPLFHDVYEGENDDAELRYRQYVYDTYLDVPKELQELMDEICDEYVSSDTVDEIILDIQKYFYDNYTYSLSPGITPSYRDFVEYFVNKQKKGYCAHFATTGAMLLRNMGIPARYVEGYVVDVYSLEDADIVDTNWMEWYDGYNELIAEDEESAAALSVEISDAGAHAWVEIYMDGFGWVPVEFTVAEQESIDSDGQSFWERFEEMLDGDDDTQSPIENISAQLEKSAPIIIIVFCVGVIGVFTVFFGRTAYRRWQLYSLPDGQRLVLQYGVITNLLKKCGIAQENNIYHHRAMQYCINDLGLQDDIIRYYIQLVEHASYSNEPLHDEQLNKATEIYRSIVIQCSSRCNRAAALWMRIRY